MYVPFEQKPRRNMYLVIRSDTDPAYLTAGVRSAVKDLDREQPIADVRTMEDYLARTTSSQDIWALLMGSFATVALLLAASGIFGVISHSVSQRTHEIGVRMAMGAKRSQVLFLVLRRSMFLVLLGLCIGVAGALAFTRLMTGLLFAVEPTDPVTFVTVSVVMVSVAAAASFLPSRRAATIDPVLVLKSE
jgi:putative ABC transport system permease protein